MASFILYTIIIISVTLDHNHAPLLIKETPFQLSRTAHYATLSLTVSLVTFERFDQSDEKTWPNRQKDKYI